MEELLGLVREYREADSLEKRTRAAEALIIKVRPRLAAFLARRLTEEDAKDVIQKTVKGIADNLHQLRATSGEQVLGWCYQVAKYKLASWLRQKARLPIPVDPDTLWHMVEATDSKEPISPGEGLDLKEAIRLLRTLEPPCYDYVWQRLWLEMDWATIGQLHGKTEDAARMAFTRCLAKARGLLGPLLRD